MTDADPFLQQSQTLKGKAYTVGYFDGLKTTTMPKIVTNLVLFMMIFLTLPALADDSIHEYQLPNGLTLVVKPDHRAPLVLSEIWYKVGSSNETYGISGVSHVLEHMMFKGTPTYPSSKIFSLVAEHGGDQNAMTGQDFTMYYQEWAPDNLALSFSIEADRMQNLTLDPTLFVNERKVTQEERKLRIDNDPTMQTYERFNAAVFPNNPYSIPTAGWPGDLQQLTVDDLRTWYQTWYAPNNAIVVVVGDVNPDAVYQLAEEHFGSIKPRTLPALKQFTLLPRKTTTEVVVKAPANLPVLYMGFNVPSAVSEHNSREPYALDVLNNILAGSDSARLQKQLVRGKSIAGSVDTQYNLYARLSTSLTIAAMPAEGQNTQTLRQAILQQIQALQTTPVAPAELARVKTRVLAERTYAQDSLTDEAFMIGSLESVGLSAREIDNYQRQINQVTAADVQAVAKKYLIPGNMTIGTLLPQAITNQTAPVTPAVSAEGTAHVN
jgi:zinc protease